MKKLTVLVFFGCLFLNLSFIHAVNYETRQFRLYYYVLYEVLHRVEGIPVTEFDNVQVLKEAASEFKFEYNGKTYRARNIAKGGIYVEMPEGSADRYLSRKRAPSIVLTSYDNY